MQHYMLSTYTYLLSLVLFYTFSTFQGKGGNKRDNPKCYFRHLPGFHSFGYTAAVGGCVAGQGCGQWFIAR